MYFVEVSRHAGWSRAEIRWTAPETAFNLATVKQVAVAYTEDDTAARVVDGNGEVYAHYVRPYEAYAVDLCRPPNEWLEGIRADYGIGPSGVATAAREWLAKHMADGLVTK